VGMSTLKSKKGSCLLKKQRFIMMTSLTPQLPRSFLTCQTSNDALQRATEDRRNQRLRGVSQALPPTRALDPGHVRSRQQSQQLRVQAVQHVTQKFVRVLLLIASKSRNDSPNDMEQGLRRNGPLGRGLFGRRRGCRRAPARWRCRLCRTQLQQDLLEGRNAHFSSFHEAL